MDADDISILNRFEMQNTFLEEHPEVDMVVGAISEIDEKGNDRGRIIRYPTSPEDCRAFFTKRNPVAHPTVMFRRSFFEKAGYHYPTVCSNIPIFMEVSSEDEVMFFELDNIESLANSIKNISKYKSISTHFQNAYISKYTVDKMTENYFNIYKSI